MKNFIKESLAESRLWVIVALIAAFVACAWYVRDHAKHPIHHVSDAIK